MTTEPILFILLHKLHVTTPQTPTYFLDKYCILTTPGDFFVFYMKNVYKTKHICVIKKIQRRVVDTHAHIQNMHRATLHHMLCILKVHFGAFNMVNLALKFTKK